MKENETFEIYRDPKTGRLYLKNGHRRFFIMKRMARKIREIPEKDFSE